MSLLLLFLALAIGVSFICSILEAVLLSVSDSYVAMLESDNNPDGRLLRHLKDDIDRPLATILSLNTIAHTVGAAGVGAQALVVFGDAYLSITSAVLTLLILIFSEIIPKTLGATYWRQLAPLSARFLKLLIVILYPLVWLSNKITRLISQNEPTLAFSRDEFTAMAERGGQEGILEDKEVIMFKNLMLFKSLRAKDVMTPRIVVVAFSVHQTVKQAVEHVETLRFSRVPLFDKHPEDICGYLLKNDLLLETAKGNFDTPLSRLKRELLVVPETLSLKSLFDELMERREHIAALVDEYAGFCGIVTLEDIVETLLGLEIMDEIDDIEDMQQLARKNWQKRAARLGLVTRAIESEREPDDK